MIAGYAVFLLETGLYVVVFIFRDKIHCDLHNDVTSLSCRDYNCGTGPKPEGTAGRIRDA